MPFPKPGEEVEQMLNCPSTVWEKEIGSDHVGTRAGKTASARSLHLQLIPQAKLYSVNNPYHLPLKGCGTGLNT